MGDPPSGDSGQDFLIRRAAAEWLTAIDSVSEGVALVVAGRMLRCNRAFALRFGLDVKTVKGTWVREVLRPLLGELDFGPLERQVVRTAAGEHLEVSIRPAPSLPGGWSVTVREVTEAVRADGLAGAIALVEGSGVLVAGVCHELQDPLAALSSALALLEADNAAPAGLLARMRAAAERMQFLVSGLRGSRGGQAMHAQPLQLAVELERFLGIARAEAAQRGVSMQVAVEPGLQVHADSRALFQVLHNVVANAFHALAGVSDASLRLEAQALAGEVLLEVVDNGAGMSSAQCARAFRPFETTREQGTGMGLFVVRRLMESMGGKVWLASGARSGTTVNLLFAGSPPGSAPPGGSQGA